MAIDDLATLAALAVDTPRPILKNIQLVTVRDGETDILMPRVKMSRAEAINLAAHLVALNDAEDEFNETLAALECW